MLPELALSLAMLALIRRRAHAMRQIHHSRQSSSSLTTLPTVIVSANDPADVALAGEHIRAGRLVAFPTETVYGLGANALDEDAVRNIFKTKGRPLSDPVIVHVASQQEAARLLDFDLAEPAARALFESLAKRFWPGPLTIVGRANLTAFGGKRSLIDVLSAGTGKVGVRLPRHAVAQAFLRECRVPVAAPSANRFGHVSPTSAQHVFDDLGAFSITILDGGPATCAVGIESTVVGLPLEPGEPIRLYRQGGVSEFDLRSHLKESGFAERFELAVMKLATKPNPSHKPDGAATPATDATTAKPDGEVTAAPAPGQLLTHYAPEGIASYMLTMTSSSSIPLERAVVIDFGGRISPSVVSGGCVAYRDLSPSGDAAEACKVLFETLRWTESYAGRAEAVLLPDADDLRPRVNAHQAPGLADRLFRAASGKKVSSSTVSISSR